MSKIVSDLNEAKATRAAKAAQIDQREAQRPRLAERLVQLAPLARAPLVAEDDTETHGDGLSRLADGSRFGQQTASPASTQSGNALVPSWASQLPKSEEPVRLSRVGSSAPLPLESLDEHTSRRGQHVLGFTIGVAIAAAIGIGLYAYLI